LQAVQRIPSPTWEDFLRRALDEIRFYSANSVQVMWRMKALVSDLISLVPKNAIRRSDTGRNDYKGRSLGLLPTLKKNERHRSKAARGLAGLNAILPACRGLSRMWPLTPIFMNHCERYGHARVLEKLVEFVRNLIRKQHHGAAGVDALHVRPDDA